MIHDSWILYFNKRIGIILFILEQIQVVRRGSRFDPVKYVKEVSHVEHMPADSLLIHSNFSSKLMITWLNLFENPLLIRFPTERKFWSN